MPLMQTYPRSRIFTTKMERKRKGNKDEACSCQER